jgi:hypothetical protein
MKRHALRVGLAQGSRLFAENESVPENRVDGARRSATEFGGDAPSTAPLPLVWLTIYDRVRPRCAIAC